jgi:O-antigen/teichoic acid export membrane protein
VLNTLGLPLPIILLSAWYGIQAAGFLGVAQRVTLLPAALIGVAVGQVFCGELTARLRANERDNRRLYLRISARLGLMGSMITVALLVLSRWLFPIILGSNWAQAGAYAQATAVTVGLAFMASPMSYVFIAYQKTVIAVTADVSRIALVCGLGLVSHLSGWSALSTVWMMYGGIAANYVMTWVVGLAVTSQKGPALPLADSSVTAREVGTN